VPLYSIGHEKANIPRDLVHLKNQNALSEWEVMVGSQQESALFKINSLNGSKLL
jgi:hypothetical protein